jgi:STE24 endopeptidase
MGNSVLGRNARLGCYRGALNHMKLLSGFRQMLALTFVLATTLVCVAARVPGPQTSPPAASSSQSSAQPLFRYSLPPDKLVKAHALYSVEVWMYFAATVWSMLVLGLMLFTSFGARLRNWVERISRFRFVQAVVVMSLFVLVMQIAQLPFDLYEHSISLKYGTSVQHWGSWFGDWGKSLLLGALVTSLLGWILYAVLRRSARRWWFYFWLALIPIVVFALFVTPIWVEPMFNQFEPLSDHHSDLVAQIERVVHRAGMDIPPERMFEMKASQKRTTLNAYVTGFGSTKRVVVWDTTVQHMTIPETLFVFGHEMGHYVLGHIPKEMAITLLVLLVLFYVGYRAVNWLVLRYGARWEIRSLADWASLPLLALVLVFFTFLATPIFSGVSRYYEHQADQYGAEVIHGLVPDSPSTAAHAFQVLGEESLDYPYVGKFVEFWMWDHPTISDRVIFVENYDPWGQGRQPEFVKNEP